MSAQRGVTSDIGRFGIVPPWVLDRIDGDGRAMLVYVTLATHTDRGAPGWKISRQQLADEARCSLSKLARGLATLTDLGLLDIAHNITPDGDLGWSTYYLRMTPGDGESETGSDQNSEGVVADEDRPHARSGTVVTDPSTDPQTDPTTNPQHNSTPQAAHGVSDDGFLTWWALYPRKAGKKPAGARWAKMSDHERQLALDAVHGWIDFATQHPDGTQFVPYASTWLNQERWLEPAPAPPARPLTKSTQALKTAMTRRMNGTGSSNIHDRMKELEA